MQEILLGDILSGGQLELKTDWNSNYTNLLECCLPVRNRTYDRRTGRYDCRNTFPMSAETPVMPHFKSDCRHAFFLMSHTCSPPAKACVDMNEYAGHHATAGEYAESKPRPRSANRTAG